MLKPILKNEKDRETWLREYRRAVAATSRAGTMVTGEEAINSADRLLMALRERTPHFPEETGEREDAERVRRTGKEVLEAARDNAHLFAASDFDRMLQDVQPEREQALRADVDRLTRERDDLQDAIRVAWDGVAWDAIDATTSLENESAMRTLIQAVPLEVRQRWAREDGG